MKYYNEDFKQRMRAHTRASKAIAETPRFKRQDALSLIQEQFPNYHPLKALAQLVHLPELAVSDQIAIHTTLAKYIAPQLKQIDIHAHIDSEVVYRPRIKRFDGSLPSDDEAEDADILSEVDLDAVAAGLFV